MKQLPEPDGRDVGAWGRLTCTQTSAKVHSYPYACFLLRKFRHTLLKKTPYKLKNVYESSLHGVGSTLELFCNRDGSLSVWGHVRGIHSAILRSLFHPNSTSHMGSRPQLQTSGMWACNSYVSQRTGIKHTHTHKYLQWMLFDIGLFMRSLILNWNSSLNGSILRDLGWNYCGFSRDHDSVFVSRWRIEYPRFSSRFRWGLNPW